MRRLEIDPDYGGPQTPTQNRITISNDHNVFQRSWRAVHGVEQHDVVTEETINALLRALQAPILRTPSADNLGVTLAWLAEQAHEQVQSNGHSENGEDGKRQAFLRSSFTDTSLVQKLLPGVISESWTDDAAWVHISIVFSNGAHWTTETTALTPYMLPWLSKVDGNANQTYNADISRAVVALLPSGTLNLDRLAGVGLGRLIGSAVEQSIKPEWQRIHAEDRAGPELALLREHYIIRRSEVSSYQNLVSDWLGTSLHADVRLSSFPENLVVALIVPIKESGLSGVESFLHSGDKYVDLLLANPWLLKSLRAHPDLGAWLYFVSDASLSEAALRVFTADMHEIGRDDLVREVTKQRRDVALLNYYGNHLILFPDNHAIVWRWDIYRDIFDWKASSLKPKRCSAYNTVIAGCVGAIITSDGDCKGKLPKEFSTLRLVRES